MAFPDRAAVIVPALKFPDASLATTLLGVLASVASTSNVRAVPPLYAEPLKYEPGVSEVDIEAVIVPALKFPEPSLATTLPAVLASVASTVNVWFEPPSYAEPVKYEPGVSDEDPRTVPVATKLPFKLIASAFDVSNTTGVASDPDSVCPNLSVSTDSLYTMATLLFKPTPVGRLSIRPKSLVPAVLFLPSSINVSSTLRDVVFTVVVVPLTVRFPPTVRCDEHAISPVTSRSLDGDALLIPTLLSLTSTTSLSVPTTKSFERFKVWLVSRFSSGMYIVLPIAGWYVH